MDKEVVTTPKPKRVKIKDISATTINSTENIMVYGVGSDQQLYCWSGKERRWILA